MVSVYPFLFSFLSYAPKCHVHQTYNYGMNLLRCDDDCHSAVVFISILTNKIYLLHIIKLGAAYRSNIISVNKSAELYSFAFRQPAEKTVVGCLINTRICLCTGPHIFHMNGFFNTQMKAASIEKYLNVLLILPAHINS